MNPVGEVVVVGRAVVVEEVVVARAVDWVVGIVSNPIVATVWWRVGLDVLSCKDVSETCPSGFSVLAGAPVFSVDIPSPTEMAVETTEPIEVDEWCNWEVVQGTSAS